MDERMSSMFIFLIIFNILFPPISYAFTVFPDEPEESQLNIVIDSSRLAEYDVSFTNATSFNITYGDDWDYFNYNEKELRVKWYDGGLFAPDHIVFQKKDAVGQYLGWFFHIDCDLTLLDSGLVIDNSDSYLENGTIIEQWDLTEDWMRVSIDYGVLGFFTTTPADYGNITRAVMETGTLTLTVGESETSTYDMREFADWYWNTIFNTEYGAVPSSIQWIMRALTVLNFVAGVYAIKDLFRV